MATKLPYLPFYPADYLADTSHLTLKEHGAYLLLLFALWQRRGELVNDDSRLPKILGITKKEWDSIKGIVMPFFTIQNGLITHGRITCEINKAKEKSEKAKESAEKRWNNSPEYESERNANALPPQCSPDSYSYSDTDNTIREDINNKIPQANFKASKRDFIFPDNSPELKLAETLYTEHLRIDPDFLAGHDINKTMQSWAREIEKLIRIDHRTPDQIDSIIVFAQGSDFWNSNILSGAKLRKQFPTLFAQWKKAKPESNNKPVQFRTCPNAACGKPVYGSLSFCTECGTDMNPRGDF